MIVGVPKELKEDENRVGILPTGARGLIESGHMVYIEKGASDGAGVPDIDYIEAGATVVDTAEEIWSEADVVVKVKEPLPEELARTREGQVVFTFFPLGRIFPTVEKLHRSGGSRLAPG